MPDGSAHPPACPAVTETDGRRHRHTRIDTRSRSQRNSERLELRSALSHLRRIADESDTDLALRQHLQGERYSLPGLCRYCHAMPWRRKADGCQGCGLAYEPEAAAHPVPDMKSSACDW